MKKLVLAGVGVGTAAFVISDVVNREMSPVGETISRFVNTGAGWLVPLGLVAIAVAAAALTVAVARTGTSRAGTWLLGLWSAGLLLAAIFPADPPGQWDNPSVSESVHGFSAWVAFAAFTAAGVVLTRAWPKDAPLTGATYVLVSGMILFVVTLVDVMVARSLPPVVGLTERVAIAACLGWMALAAVRLPRTGR
ncbi:MULTISPECIES: DUF998 domain-containing protein [Streptosporangium]|uniref:FtsH-binding integral membrane protein n=1 Tax=Streptosporangium brasiliense TaxID=47480 RepID=A0ABT9RHA1_9ACTN|nr:DUF998 domain-containing protein [Streptosporangium brasiliense]MDP9868252.1 FtsH-binding integral membrane protein [Streptosporangium brasiliense]